MTRILFAKVMLLALSMSAAAQSEKLHGTWRLQSAVTTVLATGEQYDTYGKDPRGYITYGPDGRMQVMIASSLRPKPGHAAIADMPDAEAKELLRTMASYAGTYAFDGKTVTHHIEISWNEVWAGTSQVRDVRFNGDQVTLTTRPAPSPRDGRPSTNALTWERVK